MRSRILALFCAITLTFAAYAQPQSFRTMFRNDPATTMVLGWSQPLIGLGNGTNFQLFYDTVDHGTDESAYASGPVPVTRQVMAFKGLNHYFVRLENLPPNSPIHFLLKYTDPLQTTQYIDAYWSETLSDNPNDPISIISGGDSRANYDEPQRIQESFDARKESNKIVSKLRADFVMFGGDYTFFNDDEEWMRWMQDWELTYASDGRITPIIATLGNHEAFPFLPPNGPQVIEQLFDTPVNDGYYALSFGGNLIRVYTLNTETEFVEQGKWLEEDLKQHNLNTYWKVAQYHKAIRPHEAGKSDMDGAYDNWVQHFFDYQVRIAFESDAHVVKTTWPLMPSLEADGTTFCDREVEDNFMRVAEDAKGIVFVGEGTWAANRGDADDPKVWTRGAMPGMNQVKWTWVTKDKMEVRTVRTYNPANLNYVNNMEELTDENRFTEPEGIDIIDGGEGKVVFITGNGLTPRPVLDECGNVKTTSVQEVLADNKLVIMPNPASKGKVNVILKGASARDYSIVMYNLSGKKMVETTGTVNNGSVNKALSTENIPAGTYYIQLKVGAKTYTQKLVVMK
ncbi:MAG: T9SS type A sorting domain-containing protein [Luteibaculum sp.]